MVRKSYDPGSHKSLRTLCLEMVNGRLRQRVHPKLSQEMVQVQSYAYDPEGDEVRLHERHRPAYVVQLTRQEGLVLIPIRVRCLDKNTVTMKQTDTARARNGMTSAWKDESCGTADHA